MINSIGPQIPITPPSPSTPGSGTSQTAFVDALKSAVDHVEISSKAAAKSVEGFLEGETEDIHTVGLANQRAELEFDMLLQVRNKVVQAYQEIMRMPL
jgi:flagellar hook-basal body complex protein FliE